MLSVSSEQEINESKSLSYLEQSVHAVVVHLAQGIVGLIDPLWNDGVYCSLKNIWFCICSGVAQTPPTGFRPWDFECGCCLVTWPAVGAL